MRGCCSPRFSGARGRRPAAVGPGKRGDKEKPAVLGPTSTPVLGRLIRIGDTLWRCRWVGFLHAWVFDLNFQRRVSNQGATAHTMSVECQVLPSKAASDSLEEASIATTAPVVDIIAAMPDSGFVGIDDRIHQQRRRPHTCHFEHSDFGALVLRWSLFFARPIEPNRT